MRIPRKLRAGDRVGIVSTSRKITEAELAPAMASLRAWGLEPVPGRHIYNVSHQFAGTDAERLQDLQDMLDREDIQAILCSRGGYGSLRIVDGLSLKGLKKHPKWLVGFSDVTTFTMALYNAGVASIHGPMAISWDGKTGDEKAREYLRRMLMADTPTYSYTPLRADLIRTGKASGPVIGGNLSMLSQLLGTDTDFKTKGCILFLEDLDEYLYHIDRMVVHLRRGGKFDDLAGLIVGRFSDIHDNSTPFGKTAEEIIAEAVADQAYPVCYDFPVGHCPENYPLLHGVKATLKVSHTRVDLAYDEG